MASERLQRRIERLLDQIDEAEAQGKWESVRNLALDVLEVDSENPEATAYLGPPKGVLTSYPVVLEIQRLQRPLGANRKKQSHLPSPTAGTR